MTNDERTIRSLLRLFLFMEFSNYPKRSQLRQINDSEYIWDEILNIKCGNTESGVYAFIFKNNVIYIGLTHSIRQRVKRHYTNKNHKEFTMFLHQNYKDIEIILIDKCCQHKVEMKYINYYKPLFNRFYYEV
jgi:predicted GIY-YIG superfamily endonuclease